jgi:hypothetical protein
MCERIKRANRYEVDLTPPEFLDADSGIKVTATHKGIEIFGWYDTFVGIDNPKLIPWEDINKARGLLAEGVAEAKEGAKDA